MTTPHLERIVVDNSQRGGFMRDTVLHEALHACLFATGLNLGDGEEERLVAALSPVLLAALRDNPALVAYLRSDD